MAESGYQKSYSTPAASQDATSASACDLSSEGCELGAAASKARDEVHEAKAASRVKDNQGAELGAPDKISMEAMFAVAAGQIEENGPLIYRCTQGLLFVKRSENPECPKIIKLKRPVGATIHATGYTWTGPSGGVWAELEASKGEMGWMLVKGPGFGLKGPALVDASDLVDATSLRIILVDREPGVIYESWVRRDITIFDLKKTVAAATGLAQRFCCLIKDPPAKIPGTEDRLPADYCEELKDKSTLESIGCGDNTQLYLMYVHDYPEGFPMPKPLLKSPF